MLYGAAPGKLRTITHTNGKGSTMSGSKLITIDTSVPVPTSIVDTICDIEEHMGRIQFELNEATKDALDHKVRYKLSIVRKLWDIYSRGELNYLKPHIRDTISTAVGNYGIQQLGDNMYGLKDDRYSGYHFSLEKEDAKAVQVLEGIFHDSEVSKVTAPTGAKEDRVVLYFNRNSIPEQVALWGIDKTFASKTTVLCKNNVDGEPRTLRMDIEGVGVPFAADTRVLVLDSPAPPFGHGTSVPDDAVWKTMRMGDTEPYRGK